MKKKKITSYQKAVDMMERETNRALAHVDRLNKMYQEMKKKDKSQVVVK